MNSLTARLRGALAAASVESLEPDLVILDEFQRFRHLIDPNSGSAASELAHHLFNYRDAKVLLLSATPYKPYTTVAGDSEDDHYRDFMTTLEFLGRWRCRCAGTDPLRVPQLSAGNHRRVRRGDRGSRICVMRCFPS